MKLHSPDGSAPATISRSDAHRFHGSASTHSTGRLRSVIAAPTAARSSRRILALAERPSWPSRRIIPPMNTQTKQKHTPSAVGIKKNGMEILAVASRPARAGQAGRPTCQRRTPYARVGTPCLLRVSTPQRSRLQRFRLLPVYVCPTRLSRQPRDGTAIISSTADQRQLRRALRRLAVQPQAANRSAAHFARQKTRHFRAPT